MDAFIVISLAMFTNFLAVTCSPKTLLMHEKAPSTLHLYPNPCNPRPRLRPECLLLYDRLLPRVAPVAPRDRVLGHPDDRPDPLPGEEVEVRLGIVGPVPEDPPHPDAPLRPPQQPLQPPPITDVLRRHVHGHHLTGLHVHGEVYLQVPFFTFQTCLIQSPPLWTLTPDAW